MPDSVVADAAVIDPPAADSGLEATDAGIAHGDHDAGAQGLDARDLSGVRDADTPDAAGSRPADASEPVDAFTGCGPLPVEPTRTGRGSISRIAWDGRAYLVVFTAPVTAERDELRAAVVSVDGRPNLWSTSLVEGRRLHARGLVWNGSEYGLVWAETAPRFETCGFGRLDARGALIPGSTFELAVGCRNPHLLWDPTRSRWVVAFNVDEGRIARWAEVTATGTSWSRAPETFGPAGGLLADSGNALIRAGDRYVAVLSRYMSTPVLAEIEAATSVVRTTTVGTRASAVSIHAVVAAQGTRYAVAWLAQEADGFGEVALALVDRGARAVPNSQRSLSTRVQSLNSPVIVADGAGFAASWSFGAGRDGSLDAAVARLDGTGRLVSTTTIASPAWAPMAHELSPDLHWNGCQLAVAFSFDAFRVTDVYFGLRP